ncbi:hypothetical protein DYY67_0397 [Candidatus Nitrosotalea sp. TS]|nr:hypothetical protein [Candidatus Nitrosotalea sp. TS]
MVLEIIKLIPSQSYTKFTSQPSIKPTKISTWTAPGLRQIPMYDP